MSVLMDGALLVIVRPSWFLAFIHRGLRYCQSITSVQMASKQNQKMQVYAHHQALKTPGEASKETSKDAAMKSNDMIAHMISHRYHLCMLAKRKVDGEQRQPRSAGRLQPPIYSALQSLPIHHLWVKSMIRTRPEVPTSHLPLRRTSATHAGHERRSAQIDRTGPHDLRLEPPGQQGNEQPQR